MVHSRMTTSRRTARDVGALIGCCTLLTILGAEGTSTGFPGTLPAVRKDGSKRTQPLHYENKVEFSSSSDEGEGSDLESSSDFDYIIEGEKSSGSKPDLLFEQNSLAPTISEDLLRREEDASQPKPAERDYKAKEENRDSSAVGNFDEEIAEVDAVVVDVKTDSSDEGESDDALTLSDDGDVEGEGQEEVESWDSWEHQENSAVSEDVENDQESDDSSAPLRTLRKLQQMLDDTDYMTSARDRREERINAQVSSPKQGKKRQSRAHPEEMRSQLPNSWQPPPPPIVVERESVAAPTIPARHEMETGRELSFVPTASATESPPVVTKVAPAAETAPPNAKNAVGEEKLWTSKDRYKYKRQQQMVRRAQEERRRLQQQMSPPINPNSSDDEATDSTDDGLGYTLPNLPIYMSDAENSATEGTDTDITHQQQQQTGPKSTQQQPPPPPFAQQSNPYYQHQMYNPYNMPPPPNQVMGQTQPFVGYPPNAYLPYPPYGYPPNQGTQYPPAWGYTSPYQRGAASQMYPRPTTRSTLPIRRETSPPGTSLRQSVPVAQSASAATSQSQVPINPQSNAMTDPSQLSLVQVTDAVSLWGIRLHLMTT